MGEEFFPRLLFRGEVVNGKNIGFRSFIEEQVGAEEPIGNGRCRSVHDGVNYLAPGAPAQAPFYENLIFFPALGPATLYDTFFLPTFRDKIKLSRASLPVYEHY